MTYSKECLEKQQKIYELEEKIASLKSNLSYQERTVKEGFFGSSTPFSRLPVKPNSRKEQQRNRGGGKVAHQCGAAKCSCQVLILKSTFGVCGGSTLYLRQHIKPV